MSTLRTADRKRRDAQAEIAATGLAGKPAGPLAGAAAADAGAGEAAVAAGGNGDAGAGLIGAGLEIPVPAAAASAAFLRFHASSFSRLMRCFSSSAALVAAPGAGEAEPLPFSVGVAAPFADA